MTTGPRTLHDAFVIHAEAVLVACRAYLQAADVPADDIPDDEVIPRVKALLLHRHVTFMVGSFDKRFARDLASYPPDRRLSERQIGTINDHFVRYRRQIRSIPAHDWPAGLPRPPKDR